MTDHINPNPPAEDRTSRLTVGKPPMRAWIICCGECSLWSRRDGKLKRIGIGALVALLLMLVGGGAVVVGTASDYVYRVKAAQRDADWRQKYERGKWKCERWKQANEPGWKRSRGGSRQR